MAYAASSAEILRPTLVPAPAFVPAPAVASSPAYVVETSSINILDVQIGSRVTLTHNANVDLGLFNGSIGTVVSIVFPKRGVSQGVHLLPIMFVCFDNYVGSRRTSQVTIPRGSLRGYRII